MSFGQILGFGEKKIFAQKLSVPGRITAVKKCWWLKVNTKAVRMGPMDGAMFPHIAVFTYEVNGTVYEVKRWVSSMDTPPKIGKTVEVYYDRQNPQKYAVKL